ncbi:uncharacterized protein KGF55_002522 [Candida pseudojiufengensis]|uniref:uncharacterized protein n=1 Tax=Candida pseudojiufengensis TaxID=497109 RepID=UPI00222489E5|nr:uncharacterized protein KGF55_002522 [Candida pseudojiufengensis]KAI5963642.1 hypothetical protein KGF55_002522 [Candida pseudojiufengensis]
MSESAQLNASLLRLKLLDALRSGDTSKIDSIIQELISCKATIQNQDLKQLRETILHYAVQVANLDTIQYLINNQQKYGLDINAQDNQGNTPLHLAAIASRQDVVKYLLSLPNINDTIVNNDKKQPVEVCKDKDIIQLMQYERAKFVEKAAGDLRIFFSNRDFENLENLLILNPRASELLDINGADPTTGNTVLHEFISKDDLPMCDWILKHGGDPFKRDKRGKLPVDLVKAKDEPLKKLIKDASKDQTIMDPVATSNAVPKSGGIEVYKGYLRKWTNFASGYKLRYFILDQNGILSYYADQDDTSCRGSLNLGYATLHLDSSEKMKFEIYGKNGLRWHLKANFPVETNRWVWKLQNAITASKDNIRKRNQLSNNTASGTVSPEELQDSTVEDNESVGEKKKHRLRIPGRKKHHKRNVSQVSRESFENGSDVSRSSTSHTLADSIANQQLNARASVDEQYSVQDTDHENFDYDADEIEREDYDSDNDSNTIDINQINDSIAATRRSLHIELSSLLELFHQVMSIDVFQPNSKQAEVCVVGNNTIRAISDLITKYNIIVDTRDNKLRKDLDRQVEVNQLWERSIRQLENEIKSREDKLAVLQGQRKQLRKYFSGGAGTKSGGAISPLPSTNNGDGNATGVAKGEILSEEPQEDQIHAIDNKLGGIERNEVGNEDLPVTAAQEEVNHMPGSLPDNVIGELLGDDSEDEFFDADEFDDEIDVVAPPNETDSSTLAPVQQDVSKEEAPKVNQSNETAATQPPSNRDDTNLDPAVKAGAGAGAVGAAGAGIASSQDESIPPEQKIDNSSFEPSESNQQGVPPSNTAPAETADSTNKNIPGDEGLNPAQKEVNHELQAEGSFLGYENPPRKKLGMDEDNRPKVGLWGILKSMIGKDMTRMTLPVSFNEPTSLLQRLAEDIEYNDLLNKAAGYDDSTLRLIYVATFAATEYSSTIDRIAKPFNPLLGETFEYSRPDQNYRLIVEQVSHHPPISACHATSPKWEYYGENAVDSKFSGRSFDFKHLGKMFAVVRPNNGVKDKKGNLVSEELYSWKKVNTAVVGIMIGNPTVDNYGKMIVENHTTGDTITVDMKQRGWRASSAYQLSGQALDAKGVPQWAMGGYWNSKIFAKKITKDQQHHDSSRKMSILDDPNKSSSTTSTDPFSGNKFLVWQVAPRPKVPFNLTQFAVTLNGVDSNLKKWLAPTDTRLRPDQRDMEEGRYDKAADEKHRVEVKQRQARKQREETGQTYKPNWFIKKKHPITGDMYWEYNGEYWPQRKEHNLAGSGDIF